MRHSPLLIGGTIARRLLGASALLGATALAGCAADSPTSSSADAAPFPTAQAGSRPASTPVQVNATVSGAVRRKPIPADLSASATIGHKGGWVSLSAAGGYLYVPPGAVSVPTTFTMTAVAGSMIAYEFEPHGVTFARPVKVFQRTTGTYGLKPGSNRGLAVGYFIDRSALDPATNTARVRELLSMDTRSIRGVMVFSVQHFSGYMVSSGRARDLDSPLE